MDNINKAILQHLKANSRMSWQQIGKQVHLTGQAVAARVQHMQDQSVISGYTIRQDKLERHFIAMFMENPDFARFEQFLQTQAQVESAYKVTGDACYHLVFAAPDSGALESFLNALLKFGKYKVLSAIRTIK